MLFYLYDPTTHEALGSREVYADPRTGGYSAPAHATHVAPPTTAEHQAAVFDEAAGAWTLMPDWRAVTFYNVTTGEAVHLTLGEQPTAALTETKPTVTVSEAQKAKEALAYSDVVDMGRVTEDLIDTLAAKGILALADLPQAVQAKLAARKTERVKIAEVSS